MATTLLTTTGTVTSADGTSIAYERRGSGPPLILISSALSTRDDLRRLASLLPFTVINYDRRGRGESGDAPPYSPSKEVDDLAALLSAYPGAALFGTSSGAVLALDAAHLGARAVIAYEAPLIVDASRPPVPHALPDEIDALVDAGHPASAVRLFMRSALGVGWLVLGILMAMWPVWRGMVAMARTAAYDCRLCAGLQDGKELPRDRWRFTCPVLVAVGQNAEEFMQVSSRQLAEMLSARHEIVQGAHHGSPVMNPAVLVPLMTEFLSTSEGDDKGHEAGEDGDGAKGGGEDGAEIATDTDLKGAASEAKTDAPSAGTPGAISPGGEGPRDDLKK
ncbi:alpha/beta-hydrolase [Cutaneotrichosporon oleaginosum]|uniref:Alpha/beta-hydrolase n=1 Tax=Cutaneotrichosporon oleaginosum TaxID=879819 RepID=A0A0J0XDK4_9TREE|nr:alpha/beta-hydrolase [Cutaneotrichosporon oleaginosum]KLT39161.1 alpha/beta-hydrolase [Cutaneotrichosporon oleaginosum]TXT05321.1 hypothetical protein COLE_06641 [Cutaneotrichosporon oleaginosum]